MTLPFFFDQFDMMRRERESWRRRWEKIVNSYNIPSCISFYIPSNGRALIYKCFSSLIWNCYFYLAAMVPSRRWCSNMLVWYGDIFFTWWWLCVYFLFLSFLFAVIFPVYSLGIDWTSLVFLLLFLGILLNPTQCLLSQKRSGATLFRRPARLPAYLPKSIYCYVSWALALLDRAVCTCVPNLLYMCEYIKFYEGGTIFVFCVLFLYFLFKPKAFG